MSRNNLGPILELLAWLVIGAFVGFSFLGCDPVPDLTDIKACKEEIRALVTEAGCHVETMGCAQDPSGGKVNCMYSFLCEDGSGHPAMAYECKQ